MVLDDSLAFTDNLRSSQRPEPMVYRRDRLVRAGNSKREHDHDQGQNQNHGRDLDYDHCDHAGHYDHDYCVEVYLLDVLHHFRFKFIIIKTVLIIAILYLME